MEGSQREDRFRALYDLSRPLVISYALRRARTPEDAADVVVAIKAFLKFNRDCKRYAEGIVNAQRH